MADAALNRMSQRNKSRLSAVKTEERYKYLLVGGFVNGEYITAKSLVGLYGVNYQQCILFDCVSSDPTLYIRNAQEEGLTVLTPRKDGDYSRAES